MRDDGKEAEGALCTIVQHVIAACRAEPRTTLGKQPYNSALAIATALTLRAMFRLALRQTEGLIGSILRLLGLDLVVPDRTTLSRRTGALEVSRPKPVGEPVHLLVNSTGRIEVVELIGHETDDGSRVGPLLDQVADPLASFTGGGANDRNDVDGAVAARHPEAEIVVPPRASAAAWAGGRRPGKTAAPWPRPPSAATSG